MRFGGWGLKFGVQGLGLRDEGLGMRGEDCDTIEEGKARRRSHVDD